MSYDVSLEIDTGGREPFGLTWRNYTSNCARMWCKAGADLAAMDGMPASAAAPVLTAAVRAMEADPEAYEMLNPANGWGDYDGCLDFLREVMDDCVANPRATLRVSH